MSRCCVARRGTAARLAGRRLKYVNSVLTDCRRTFFPLLWSSGRLPHVIFRSVTSPKANRSVSSSKSSRECVRRPRLTARLSSPTSSCAAGLMFLRTDLPFVSFCRILRTLTCRELFVINNRKLVCIISVCCTHIAQVICLLVGNSVFLGPLAYHPQNRVHLSAFRVVRNDSIYILCLTCAFCVEFLKIDKTSLRLSFGSFPAMTYKKKAQ